MHEYLNQTINCIFYVKPLTKEARKLILVSDIKENKYELIRAVTKKKVFPVAGNLVKQLNIGR